MDYETRCRRLADQIAAGREVTWGRGIDALRGAANEIAHLKDEVAKERDLRAEWQALAADEGTKLRAATSVGKTAIKASALVLAVYIASEQAILWAAR